MTTYEKMSVTALLKFFAQCAYPTVKAEKATIFVRSDMGFGIRKYEVRNLRIEIAPYAQHSNAVKATFTYRGHRKSSSLVETFRPTLVVVQGWGHDLTPDSMFGATTKGDGVETTMSRYSSCDSRWDSDFAAKLDAYLANSDASLVADYRKHVVA
jgi:hypothetical protein